MKRNKMIDASRSDPRNAWACDIWQNASKAGALGSPCIRLAATDPPPLLNRYNLLSCERR